MPPHDYCVAHLKDSLAGLSCLFSLLVPDQPPSIECVALQLWRLPVKHEDWLDFVEQQFANPVVESNLGTKQMKINFSDLIMMNTR